ncbi:MAG: hypothetical protein R3Y26_09895 [Rikenellaceae bacterium]
MNKIIFTLLIAFLASCTNQAKIKKDLVQLISAPIILPTDAKVTIHGKDTLINNHFESELKMIVYSDSLGCTSCGINKMYLWDEFVKYADGYDGRLKFYFIYSPSSKVNKTIRRAFKQSLFDYPIVIDETGEFEKKNSHLPRNHAMHAFLLDKDNKIIMVGNPLLNKDIEKLFYEQTAKLLSK